MSVSFSEIFHITRLYQCNLHVSSLTASLAIIVPTRSPFFEILKSFKITCDSQIKCGSHGARAVRARARLERGRMKTPETRQETQLQHKQQNSRDASMQVLWFAPFVSADVEALRYTGWHDVVADRRKDLYEPDTQMITVQRTRELALQAIARHMRAHPDVNPPGVDLFEFGVYTGGGMRMWLRMLARENISFAGHVWGFDSFEGMPAEDNRFKSKLRQDDKGWLAGGFNTAEQLGSPTGPRCARP